MRLITACEFSGVALRSMNDPAVSSERFGPARYSRSELRKEARAALTRAGRAFEPQGPPGAKL